MSRQKTKTKLSLHKISNYCLEIPTDIVVYRSLKKKLLGFGVAGLRQQCRVQCSREVSHQTHPAPSSSSRNFFPSKPLVWLLPRHFIFLSFALYSSNISQVEVVCQSILLHFIQIASHRRYCRRVPTTCISTGFPVKDARFSKLDKYS